MFKRIRDFIYDINDVFIALVIVLAAAGIIVWRATDIVNYPQYLANKASTPSQTEQSADPKPANTSTNTNAGQNQQDPNSGTADPNANAGQNQADPNANAGQNQQDPNSGAADPNANAAQNEPDPNAGQADPGQDINQGGEGTVEPAVTPTVVNATITIESGFKGGWGTVVNRLVSAGLMNASDKQAFIAKVVELKLDRSLRIGSFDLSSDMSFEQMIKILCKVQ